MGASSHGRQKNVGEVNDSKSMLGGQQSDAAAAAAIALHYTGGCHAMLGIRTGRCKLTISNSSLSNAATDTTDFSKHGLA